MSKYEELAKLAIADSRTYFNEREGCSNCAVLMVYHLSQYLQAPPGAITFVKLDGDLRPTGDEISAPDLRLTSPMAWQFGLQIRFGAPGFLNYGIVQLKIDVRTDDTGYSLKCDREFQVDPKNDASFVPFVDYLFSSLAEDYQRKRSNRRSTIGFLPGN